MDLARHSQPIGQRPALLLVDMIKGFTDPACPLGTACDQVVTINQSLLRAFRQAGLPIVFTTVVYHTAAQARVFRARLPALNVLTPSSQWIEVDDRLTPLEGELVLEKQWASSFFGTRLHDWLINQQADSLVVTGLSTSGCVRATVVDALQHDYPTFVPADAVGDRNPEAHQANLFDMNAKYADVVTSAEVIQQITTREQG